jgi:hypothetical protein
MNRVQSEVFKYEPPRTVTNHSLAARKRNQAESSHMQTVLAINDHSSFKNEKMNESSLTYKMLGAGSSMNLEQPSDTLIAFKQSLIQRQAVDLDECSQTR